MTLHTPATDSSFAVKSYLTRLHLSGPLTLYRGDQHRLGNWLQPSNGIQEQDKCSGQAVSASTSVHLRWIDGGSQ